MTAAPPLLVLAAGGKPRLRHARVPVLKEIKLHVSVAKLLRDHCLPDWKWTHINRKAMDGREGAILKTMGVNPNWPDFILVSPHGSVSFLETKRLGEELSDGQEEFRLWCINHGVPYAVAWTMDSVLSAFAEWKCTRLALPLVNWRESRDD